MSTTTRTSRITVALGALLLLGASACSITDEGASAQAINDPTAAMAEDESVADVTFVVTCGTHDFQREPRSFTLTCGDGNESLDGLEWQGWGGKEAFATGTLLTNDCVPSCAQGSDVSYPVKVVASNLVFGESSATYRKLTVTEVADGPGGTVRSDTYELAGNQPGQGSETMSDE